ncbi:MAG: energy transducer TonB [Muribaculaceae bacterium]|nr:energy transducer TonB [Muribaculaceae bacterium]
MPENNRSTPAPETGIDTRNSGKAGEATPTKASSRPSPVKVPAPEPKKNPAGPVEDTKKIKEEEEARRKASADLQTAFANTKGKNNTHNPGKTDGNSGNPAGSAASQQHGSGTGRVNGGWKMPSYAKVPSTMTGTIELKATIDSKGKVTAVEVIGGKAPAATNAALTEACKAEVRRRTFSRSDNNAPESATAYITYRFN